MSPSRPRRSDSNIAAVPDRDRKAEHIQLALDRRMQLRASYFEDYPHVRVCLAHMNRDDPDEALSAMRRFESLYTDTSWQTAESIANAIGEVGPERILLGSDWPLLHADLQGECARLLERAASDREVETITGPSAARFLGIDG